MEKQEILNKITLLYDDPKSNKFIKHLIYAFMPNKGTWLIQSKPDAKCCIMGCGLITLYEGAEISATAALEGIAADFKGEGKGSLELLKERLDGKVIGIMSDESDKLLCVDSFEALKEWCVNRLITDPDFQRITENLQLNAAGVTRNQLKRHTKRRINEPIADIKELYDEAKEKGTGLGTMIEEALKKREKDE